VVTSCGHPATAPSYPYRLEKVKFGVPLEEVCKHNNNIPDPQAEQGVAEPAGCVPRPRPPGGHEEADPLPAGGPPGQRGQLLGVHHRQCLEEVPAQDTQWDIRAQRRDGAVRHQRSAK